MVEALLMVEGRAARPAVVLIVVAVRETGGLRKLREYHLTEVRVLYKSNDPQLCYYIYGCEIFMAVKAV